MPQRYFKTIKQRVIRLADRWQISRLVFLLIAIIIFWRGTESSSTRILFIRRYLAAERDDLSITNRVYFSLKTMFPSDQFRNNDELSSSLYLSMGIFLADSFGKLGHFTQARQLYSTLSRPAWSRYEALCGLADLKMVHATWVKEFSEYLEAKQLIDGWSLFDLSYPEWMRHMDSDAIQLLTTAVIERPHLTTAHWLLAIAYHDAGKHAGAVTAIQALEKMMPEDYPLLAHLRASITFPISAAATALGITRQLDGWRDELGRGWKGKEVKLVSGNDLPENEGFKSQKVAASKELVIRSWFAKNGQLRELTRAIAYDEPLITEYPEATIYPMYGGIVAGDRYFVRESVHYKPTHLQAFTPNIRSLGSDNALMVYPDPDQCDAGAPLFIGNNDNYYHWLIDDLPRLNVAAKVGLLDGKSIVVDHSIKSWMLELLDRAGIPEDRVVRVNLKNPVRFRNLCAPSSFVRGYAAHPDAVMFSRNTLQKNAPRLQSRKGKRLYLKRSTKSAIALRTMINADQIETAFKKADFTFVDPAALSISDQIELFSDAEVVAGPSGAAITNMIFAPAAAKLILLGMTDVTGETFTSLTSAIGQRCYWCLGNGLARTHARWIWTNFDFFVDPNDVNLCLEAALS